MGDHLVRTHDIGGGGGVRESPKAYGSYRGGREVEWQLERKYFSTDNYFINILL